MPTTAQRFRSLPAHGRAARRIRFLTLVGATAVAAILLAGFAGSASARGHAQHGPPGLAFYDPPSQLPTGAHGTLIWERTAGGLVPLESAARTKLVLYKSRTPQGKVDVVSGSVSVPMGKPPAGGWPVITYAHGTTGAADICAPSRVHEGAPARGFITYVNRELDAWVRAPIFLAQGTADTTVFPVFTDQLDDELKDLGDRVRYQLFHGVDHANIVRAAEGDVLPWFEMRAPTGG